ncbi:MAG: SCO family protein [Deltaproteobacteria bacterium]|nr:SCO family protein [Deltaproteobacteria bacterium]
MKATVIFAVGFLVAAGILAVRIAATGAGDSFQRKGAETQSKEASFLAPSRLGVLALKSAAVLDATTVRPLKAGDAVPDARLTDQNGRTFRLNDLRGKPFVLTFIYTECNMPTMCPSTTAKLVKVRDLARARGPWDGEIVVVSFDPARDRPSRLKAFAKGYTNDFSGFRLATGTEGEVAPLARVLNTYYSENQPGVFSHNIVVSIVDARGILRDQFFGTAWEPAEVVSALDQLGLTRPSAHR